MVSALLCYGTLYSGVYQQLQKWIDMMTGHRKLLERVLIDNK